MHRKCTIFSVALLARLLEISQRWKSLLFINEFDGDAYRLAIVFHCAPCIQNNTKWTSSWFFSGSTANSSRNWRNSEKQMLAISVHLRCCRVMIWKVRCVTVQMLGWDTQHFSIGFPILDACVRQARVIKQKISRERWKCDMCNRTANLTWPLWMNCYRKSALLKCVQAA